MKAAFALFIAAAAAQTTTTAALTPQQSCLSACAPSDVNCQAICVGVPHPGENQMVETTNCVAQCDQGDGSTEASEAYGRCRDQCIASFIILSGTAAPGGAYTTAIPPGVSTSAAAAATGSASADAAEGTDASGKFTTATFLVPVCNDVACLFEPPWETVTVEVYPYPTSVLDRIDFPDCDGIVTLTSGEPFTFLPTATIAPWPATPSGSCTRTLELPPVCTEEPEASCIDEPSSSWIVEPSPPSPTSQRQTSDMSRSRHMSASPKPTASVSAIVSDGKTATTVSGDDTVGAPSAVLTSREGSTALPTTMQVPEMSGRPKIDLSDLPPLTQEPGLSFPRPGLGPGPLAPNRQTPAVTGSTTKKHLEASSSETGSSSSASESGAAASTTANAANAVQYGFTGGLAGLFMGALALL